MILNFRLTGLTPLLMHKQDIEERDRLTAWRKDPANKNRSVAGDDRAPAWTWQTGLYHDGAHLAFPSDNIMVALRQAGSQIYIKRQKTMKEISQSGLLIVEEFCEFRTHGKQVDMGVIAGMAENSFTDQANAVRKLGFRLFLKPCRIQTSSHIRVRARFDEWEISGSIQVLAPELTQEVVRQLFDLAGRVGIGSWRPGCKTPGRFGMFKAEIE